MDTVFIWKKYKKVSNQWIKNISIRIIRKKNVNKFTLHVLKCFIYDQEIDSLFAINKFFSLLKYYILNKSIRKINMQALCKKSSKIIFYRNAYNNINKKFIFFAELRDL